MQVVIGNKGTGNVDLKETVGDIANVVVGQGGKARLEKAMKNPVIQELSKYDLTTVEGAQDAGKAAVLKALKDPMVMDRFYRGLKDTLNGGKLGDVGGFFENSDKMKAFVGAVVKIANEQQGSDAQPMDAVVVMGHVKELLGAVGGKDIDMNKSYNSVKDLVADVATNSGHYYSQDKETGKITVNYWKGAELLRGAAKLYESKSKDGKIVSVDDLRFNEANAAVAAKLLGKVKAYLPNNGIFASLGLGLGILFSVAVTIATVVKEKDAWTTVLGWAPAFIGFVIGLIIDVVVHLRSVKKDAKAVVDPEVKNRAKQINKEKAFLEGTPLERVVIGF